MTTITRTLAALMLTASFASLAVPARADSTLMTADHGARASKLIGMTVYNAQNEKIGTVEDVLIPTSGGAASVVISVGSYLGGGDKMVLEPISHVKFHGDTVMMSATKAHLASMKPFTFRMASDSAG